MELIEWVVLIYFGLDIIAGFYYYSQDGYRTTPGAYVLSIFTSLGFGVWLVTLSGLTWFGWGMLGLFCYSLGVSIWRLANDNGYQLKSRGDVAMSMLISTVVVGLTLTVGLVA